MKEKILNTLFEYIQNEVEFKYGKMVTQNEFENEWKIFSKHAQIKINEQLGNYQIIHNSKSISKYKEIIEMSYGQFSQNKYQAVKDKFLELGLIDRLTHVNDWDNRHFDINSKVKVIYNFLVKEKCSEASLTKAREFGIHIRKNQLVKPSTDYVAERSQLMFESLKNNMFGKYAIKGWEDFYYDENKQLDINRFLDDIKSNVYKEYLPYYNLIETAEKYLNKEQVLKEGSFTAFIDWKVNVGSRSFHREGYNNERLISTIRVQHKGVDFKYEDRKGGKEIKGIYAKVMLHTKNEIVVLNIGEEKIINRTIYKIPGQIQRTDLVNDNKIELHMHKHFDPEVIYFDDYDEARAFQDKLEAKRQNRNRHRA